MCRPEPAWWIDLIRVYSTCAKPSPRVWIVVMIVLGVQDNDSKPAEGDMIDSGAIRVK